MLQLVAKFEPDVLTLSEVKYGPGQLERCTPRPRFEVFINEETSFEVDPQEAIGGEGDGLLPAEMVVEIIGFFQLDAYSDVG